MSRVVSMGLLLLLASGCKGSASNGTTTPATPTPVTGSAATLSVTTIAFPSFGPAGATQSLTLTNGGTVALNITSITITGNFTQSNDCGTVVAVGAACTITMTFVPTAVGTGGTLTITDDAATSPQTVTISGPNVVSPTGILSPSTLTFAAQAVGTVSPAQTVTLSNPVNGISAPLAISSTQITGDFTIAQTTCGSTLASGASCTFSLTFKPAAAGARAGTLVVVDNAPQLVQSVVLNGTGQ